MGNETATMEVNQEAIDKIKHILLKENPILFLGAGFSYGTKNAAGRSIPIGDGLKELILSELLKYDIDSEEYQELNKYPLSKVCQYVEDEYSREFLNDFICEVFRNTTPHDYHFNICKFNWSKIYTTNIDDMMETVYRQSGKDILVQNLSRASTLKKNCTQYFKLHGCIQNPSGGFTFSTAEYIDSMLSHQDFRFSSFNIDIQKEHFIFLGTSFDEVNLDYYLELYKNAGFSSRGQLFFISPNPSLILQSKVRKLKGNIIRWTTKEFLHFINNNISQQVDKSKNTERMLFHRGFVTFDYFKKEYNDNNLIESKLYSGDEPIMDDIISEWDFKHPIVDQIVSDISNRRASCFTIYGKTLIGKSCSLLRIGQELYRDGYCVILFNGRDFDTNVLKEFVAQNKTKNKFVVLIDNASYFYNVISNFKHLVSGKTIFFITTSRTYLHTRKRYALLNGSFKEYFFDSEITRPYAQIIVNKLREKGYLGELAKLADEESKLDYFVNKNDLMSGMLELTYGKGFIRRFTKELNAELSKNDMRLKSLLLDLAIIDKAELASFPVELIAMLYKTNTNDLINKVSNYIKQTKNKNYRLRSSYFTSKILDDSGKEILARNVKDILIAISPQVIEKSKNYWTEMFETLLKEKFLSKILKIDKGNIRKLLVELQNYYSDTSYYWLQLGLAEQKLSDYEKALNHFRQAEAISPTSYHVQHAIGRNFMRHANSKRNIVESSNLFKEGEKIILSLINEKELFQAKSHSVHCYLYEKIYFMKKFQVDPTNEELKELKRYLDQLTEKDEEGVMVKDITNYFYNYLNGIGKLSMIKVKLSDLNKYNFIFQEYDKDVLLDYDLD
ncbi:SIR2 family protein [Paenibacillus agaridevorans]|uniref:SIR2 family protein n=1 Tax=Paenibacillus agaridevorans TaxID=171404 RepID=A0A2R5EWL2_9BACL|nr:SIR2 family protein [Paenibacillus agaridevorans]GBG11092.1 SIR2 family protein [Paenibacillus agaridevorans]